MEQLGLAGMPQRLYRCTPTRLAAWLDCPRRYRMTYLDRPAPRKGPPWAHNSLGASVHNALAGWWRLPLGGRSVTAAGDLLDRGWIEEGFADQAQSTAMRRRARRMVEHYVADLDPGRDPVGVERTVATRTDRIAVSGRIDRLDERPEHGGTAERSGAERSGARGSGTALVVVDYKTGRRPLTTADARASMPLALYALAAARVLRRPCRRVELHHLPTGEIHAWEHSDATLARHLGRAEDIAAECADADERFAAAQARTATGASGGPDEGFRPHPGPGCGWCDFRASCPEGRAAAEARRPWDGLGSAEGE